MVPALLVTDGWHHCTGTNDIFKVSIGKTLKGIGPPLVKIIRSSRNPERTDRDGVRLKTPD